MTGPRPGVVAAGARPPRAGILLSPRGAVRLTPSMLDPLPRRTVPAERPAHPRPATRERRAAELNFSLRKHGKIGFCWKNVRAFQVAPERLIGSRPGRRLGAVRWAPRAIAGSGGSTTDARARCAYATDLPWAHTRAAPTPERAPTRHAGRATNTTVTSAQRVSHYYIPINTAFSRDACPKKC